MPSAAKMMHEHGVQSAQLDGTGKDGRITKGDVLDFLCAPGRSAVGERTGCQGAARSGRG